MLDFFAVLQLVKSHTLTVCFLAVDLSKAEIKLGLGTGLEIRLVLEIRLGFGCFGFYIFSPESAKKGICPSGIYWRFKCGTSSTFTPFLFLVKLLLQL